MRWDRLLVAVGACAIVGALASCGGSSGAPCSGGCSKGEKCVEDVCRVPCSTDAVCGGGEICSRGYCAEGNRPPVDDYVTKECSVGQFRTVTADTTITNASALANLVAVGPCLVLTGDLTIENSSLVVLDGLEVVREVGGTLRVRDNAQLKSLRGLREVKSVGRHLRVQRNAELTRLGLEALTTVVDDVVVEDNGALSLGIVDALVQRITVGGDVLTSGNAP